MADEAPNSPGISLPLWIGILVVIALVGGVSYWAGTSQYNQPVDNRDTLLAVGMGNPTTNSLASGFTDADGDLVADRPADVESLQDPATLTFCFLSGEASGVEPAQWQPLMDAISEATGRPVEYLEIPTQADQMVALRDGQLHITAFNTGGVPMAVNAAGFVPVCAPGAGESPSGYEMVIIAPADSEITQPEQIQGRTIAFTRIRSNSGFKAPIVMLRDEFSLEPERDYEWTFSYSHNASILGVASGKYDVAATASDLLAEAVADEQISEDDYRVVHTSTTFPNAAFGYAHDLTPELAEAITTALLETPIAGTDLAEVNSVGQAERFVPIDYKDAFEAVRHIDDALGVQHELN